MFCFRRHRRWSRSRRCPRRRLHPRRRARSHRVGDAEPLLRAARLASVGAGLAGSRPFGRAAVDDDRSDGGLGRGECSMRAASATATIVGHSMGALVAHALAARHADPACARWRCSAFRRRWPSPRSCWTPPKPMTPRRRELANGWSHSARARLGGNPTPGLWMLGGGAALIARCDAGVHYADLAACDAYRGDFAAITRADARDRRRCRSDDAGTRRSRNRRRACRTHDSSRYRGAAMRCCQSNRTRCSTR